jgi:hypothetical protein
MPSLITTTHVEIDSGKFWQQKTKSTVNNLSLEMNLKLATTLPGWNPFTVTKNLVPISFSSGDKISSIEDFTFELRSWAGDQFNEVIFRVM